MRRHTGKVIPLKMLFKWLNFINHIEKYTPLSLFFVPFQLSSYGRGSVASESDVSAHPNCTCSVVLKVFLERGGDNVSDSGIVLSLSVEEIIMTSLSVILISLEARTCSFRASRHSSGVTVSRECLTGTQDCTVTLSVCTGSFQRWEFCII